MVLIDIPEDSMEQKMEAMTPMEMRTYLLKKGLNPYKHMQPRAWSEHQITFQTFGQHFFTYPYKQRFHESFKTGCTKILISSLRHLKEFVVFFEGLVELLFIQLPVPECFAKNFASCCFRRCVGT